MGIDREIESTVADQDITTGAAYGSYQNTSGATEYVSAELRLSKLTATAATITSGMQKFASNGTTKIGNYISSSPKFLFDDVVFSQDPNRVRLEDDEILKFYVESSNASDNNGGGVGTGPDIDIVWTNDNVVSEAAFANLELGWDGAGVAVADRPTLYLKELDATLLAPGPNLIDNGDFTDDLTGWDDEDEAGGESTWDAGTMKLVAVDGKAKRSNSAAITGLIIGETYVLSGTVTGEAIVSVGGLDGYSWVTGEHSAEWVADVTEIAANELSFENGFFYQTAYLDNVTLRLQTDAVSRLLLTATAAKLLAYVQLLARSDVGVATFLATEYAEINKDLGVGGPGDYDIQTDSHEALGISFVLTLYEIGAVATLIGPDGEGLTNVGLAETAFDNIPTTEPSGTVATDFREMIVQTYRKNYNLQTFSADTWTVYKDDNVTVASTQAVSNPGGVLQTIGKAE